MTLIFAQARLGMVQPAAVPLAAGTLSGRSHSKTSEKALEEDALEELLVLLESLSSLRSGGATSIGALLEASPCRILEALLLLLESESLEAAPPAEAPTTPRPPEATGDGCGVVEGGGLAVEAGAAAGAAGAALGAAGGATGSAGAEAITEMR